MPNYASLTKRPGNFAFHGVHPQRLSNAQNNSAHEVDAMKRVREFAVDSPDEVRASAAKVYQSIEQQLRRDFPYMKTDTLDALARSCAVRVRAGIKEQ